MKRENRIFLIVTICVALVDLVFVLVNFYFNEKAFQESLNQEMKVLTSSFELLLSQQEQTMLKVATFVAADPEIRKIFSEGTSAAIQEGGGAGGPLAAIKRKALLQRVQTAWSSVQQRFATRQLHFHYGPKATSFLRVHRPPKFGDDLDAVRHTIVEAALTGKPTSGFESGRVYSGIRGVVPIFQPSDPGLSQQIGTVEVGTSFDTMLKLLDERFDVGAAVFMTQKHVNETMWPAAIEKRMASNVLKCDCFLEASTRDNIGDIVKETLDVFRFRDPGIDLIDIEGKHFAVTHFPLMDFLGTMGRRNEPIGAVVFWSDASDRVATLNQSHLFNIIYALFGFALVECIILIAFRYGTRELKTIIQDRTNELEEANEGLKIFQAVFHKAGEGILITDATAKIVHANDAVSKISGYSKEELVGNNPRVFSSGKQTPEYYKDMWDHLSKKGAWADEIWNRRKDGSIYAEWLNITSINNMDGQTGHYVAIFSDITNQKMMQRELEQAAFFDVLTGLPNRALLTDRMKQANAHTQRTEKMVACIYIDLDGFKDVNDNFGHEAGDFVLTETSRAILSVMRENDTLARIGGDEFVGIATDLNSQADLISLLERIIAIVNKPIPYMNNQLHVSVSIGATSFPHADEFDPEETMKKADAAMYTSKKAGKNRFTIV